MPVDPPTAELARVLSGYGQILMLLDRWSESTVLCERAVAMAREVGARQVEGHALNTLGLDLAVGGRLRRGLRRRSRRRSPSRARSPTPTTSGAATSTWARRRHLLRRHPRRASRWSGRASARPRRSALEPDVRDIHPVRTASRTASISASGTRRAGWAEESVATQPIGPAAAALRADALGAVARRRRATSGPTALARASCGCCSRAFPSRRSSTSRIALAVAEAALWRGEPGRGASSRSGRDSARSGGSEWPRYHLRLFRVGHARRGGHGGGRPGAPGPRRRAAGDRGRRRPVGGRSSRSWHGARRSQRRVDERDRSRGRDRRGRTRAPATRAGRLPRCG